MTTNLTTEALEQTYDLIAAGIDEVGSEQESLFLSKLCLTLAYRLGDPEQVAAAIAMAKQHLR